MNRAPQAPTSSLAVRTNRPPLPLILCFLAAGILLLGLAKPCSAQSYVEGVSEIIPSADGSQFYTLSETYLTPDLAYYYGAYVEGYLYQNGSGPINDGYASESPYINDAYFEMNDLISTGSDYELWSNHGVWAYWVVDVGGTDYYYNPEGFLGGGGGDSSSGDYYPGGGSVYIFAELIYLGSTAVEVGPPVISGLSPTGAGVGTSGTITVTGYYLLDVCTGNTTASITGSGVTLTVGSVSQDSTQAVLNYSIADNAETDSRTLTLTTCFGSGTTSFQVGDPTPVITAVNPNNWPAGTQTSFTISGSGFGTAPTLSVTGNGVTGSAITSSTDTQINATVNIAANAPSGTATIQVCSTGYLGSGFISTGGSGGSTSCTTAPATIGTQGTPPKIVWGPDNNGSACSGSNIAGTQPVVVGQQIAITGCVPTPPPGVTITSESWTPAAPSSNLAVAGFSVTASPTGCGFSSGQTPCDYAETLTQVSGTTCGTNTWCDFNTFYWLEPAMPSQTITFSYQLSNGQPGQASVTFNIGGPTPTGSGGTFFTATPTAGAVNVYSPTVAFAGKTTTWGLEFGNGNDIPGMNFQAAATPPQNDTGAFQWVQILASSTRRYLTNPATPNSTAGPGLDNWYPYGTVAGNPNIAFDSPGMKLVATSNGSPIPMGEGAETFSATMYLMWDPAIPGPGQQTCSPASTTEDSSGNITNSLSTCTGSIPVPLGYVNWGFSGDAICTVPNQNPSNQQWLKQNCSAPQPSEPTVQKGSAYPTWTNTVKNTL